MGLFERFSRRAVLAGQAALAGAVALPGMARARSGGSAVGACTNTPCAPARWQSATAEELAAHVGERFRVHSAEHGNMVLKLIEIEAHSSGPARPGNLSRRDGVTMVFESPDMAPLVSDGAGIYRVSHARIGSADLYMSATPRRHGGHTIDVVLN